MRRCAVAAFAAAACALAARAAEPAPAGAARLRLTMEDGVRAALANSEEIRIAGREVDRAGGQIEEARAAVLPQLGATVGYTRLSGLGGLIPGFDAAGSGPSLPSFDSLYQTDFTLTQIVYQGGQIRAGLAAARTARDQANVNYQHAATQVVYVARIAYAYVLVQHEFLDAAAESLALARKFLDNVRSRRDAGQATDFDVLQAGVRVRNAEAEEVKARTAARVARAEFLRRIGLDQGAEVELSDDLAAIADGLESDGAPPSLLGGCLSTALGSARGGVRSQGARLDLQSAELTIDLQRLVASVSTAGRRPSVAIQAAYLGSGVHGFVDEGFDFSWRAGVSVQVPVFDGFAARGKRAQALAQVAQVELARDSLARDIELEVRSAYWRLESAREFLASASGNVVQAREAVRQADVRYRNGLIAEIVLDEARVALAQARTNHAQARFGIFKAMLDLRRATGLLEVPPSGPPAAEAAEPGATSAPPEPPKGE